MSAMQSQIVAVLVPENSLEAALLVRRGDGQFNLARIDARLGAAARLAASYASAAQQHSTPENATAKN